LSLLQLTAEISNHSNRRRWRGAFHPLHVVHYCTSTNNFDR